MVVITIELVRFFQVRLGIVGVAFVECVLSKKALGTNVVFDTTLGFDDLDKFIGLGWVLHRIKESPGA